MNSNRLVPDWLVAILTASGMFIAGMFWLAKLPFVQREQQERLKRIEDKVDKISDTLARHGIFEEKG